MDQLLEQLRKDYDLDNDDLFLIVTGQETLEEILARRDTNET